MNNKVAAITIMIIDDDPENRRVLRSLLSRQGYTVRSFPDGPTALQSSREDPPDLILLDIRMPGMDGFEVCTELKADDTMRWIPVLFLSAIDETEEKIRAFEIGGADYITKPFQHDEVLARIRTQMTICSYQSKLKEANEKLQNMNIRLEQRVRDRTAALRESEEKYRRIVTTANEGIITTNENFFITYANTVIAGMLGGAVEDLIGRPISDFILEEDQKDHQEQMQDREGGLKATYERRIRCLNGETRWVIISGSPMTDSEDRFMGSVAMAIDITSRKQSEQKLRDAYQEISELKKQIEAEKIYLQEEIKLQYNYDEIIGESKEIKYTLFRVEQVATTESAVIIFGETGTGKELLARAIHNASKRRARSLIKLNCATLHEQFIESELFGHEIGAFTGAVKTRQGRFELAHSGTIFLDEIGELPLPLQAKLLRVLQDGEYERLGDSQTRKTDARIIAATNRDLDKLVQDGKFRRDLWYRLNVFPITAPPLRDRKDDIPLLAKHFINKFAKMIGKQIDQIPMKVMDELIAYDWPGNIRELEHVVERAMIISPGDRFQLADKLAATPSGSESDKLKPLASVEREHIKEALEKTNWVIHGPGGAAGILEIHPSTLRSRIQKLGIYRPNK